MARREQSTPEKTNIGVPADVNALLDDMVGPLQIKRQVLSEMIRFFHRQPAAVRTVMLDDVDPGMGHAYAEMLEKLAAEVRKNAADKPLFKSLVGQGETATEFRKRTGKEPKVTKRG